MIIIEDLIKEALVEYEYPIKYRRYSGKENTYITYFEINNFDDDYSEDKAETEVHSLQIDLFSKDELKNSKKYIQKALKAKFEGVTMLDLTEANSDINHICYRCYFYENKED